MIVALGSLILSGCDAPGLGPLEDEEAADTGASSGLPAERPLAGGLRISKVSMLQGVESILMEDGAAPAEAQAPLIIGRPGLLRVFVEPDPTFEVRRITGVLTVRTVSADTVLEDTLRITGPSWDEAWGTTLNFWIPAEAIARTTHLTLRLLEIGPDGPGGGTRASATWASARTGGLDLERTDDLAIVLVPVRYLADGSGRLPDTGPEQIQRIADRVMGMYPVRSVSVRVDPPLDWSEWISPGDQGEWTELLDAMVALRAQADEAPNTYYYGMFNPEPGIEQFCEEGCILGISYVALTADPYFRASIGVGYSGEIADTTLVHELGHAHGRKHAPCGLDPRTADQGYPYPFATLGTWGYDIVTDTAYEPSRTADMMSYCSPIWVSDYTFSRLSQRLQSVASQADRRAAPIPRTALKLNADGSSSLRPPIRLVTTEGADRVEVQVFDPSGAPVERTTGALFPYDHAPGGLVVLDEELPAGFTAAVVQTP